MTLRQPDRLVVHAKHQVQPPIFHQPPRMSFRLRF